MADVLSDPGNVGLTAEQVSAKVWEVVEATRRRKYRYVVVCQGFRRATDNGRTFYPTWVRGPYRTAAEAATAAREERTRLKDQGYLVHNKTGDIRVMSAQVFEPDELVDPATLEEVLL